MRNALARDPCKRADLLELFDTHEFCLELSARVLDVRASRNKDKLAEFSPRLEAVENDYEPPSPESICEHESLAERLAGLFFLDEALARRIALVLELPMPFTVVLNREMECIESSRLIRNGRLEPINGATAWEKAANAKLFGVALSGGGIRSATFNLGVLQALAERPDPSGSKRMLHLVDYLSTVSGGGYIGGWLHAWILRADEHCKREGLAIGSEPEKGIDHVLADMSPIESPDPEAPEQAPIKFLRRYSRYLTPEAGFFSADTWTALAIWFRNTLLNLVILILALGAVLLLPRVFHGAFYWEEMNSHHWKALGFTVGMALLAVMVAAVNLRSFDDSKRRQDRFWYQQKGVQVLIVLPLVFVAAYLTAVAFGAANAEENGSTSVLDRSWWVFGSVCAGLFFLLSIVGRYYNCWADGAAPKKRKALAWIGLSGYSLLTGAVAAGLAFLAIKIIRSNTQAASWNMLTLGTPAVLGVCALVLIAHIGFLGRNLLDDRREWWGRLGAYIGMYMLSWLSLFGTAFYGPSLVVWISHHNWASATGLSGWLLSTLAGVISGYSKNTGVDRKSEGMKSNPVLEAIAKVTPYVFVVGLLVLLSYAIQLLIDPTTRVCCSQLVQTRHAWYLDLSPLWALVAAALAAGLAFVLALRVNINEFSMHHFYRNRLIRCYLGASQRHRQPNRFTGLDPDDDRCLADLTPKVDAPLVAVPSDQPARPRYSGPYALVNATLNLVQGDELAWQDRKAQSFTFTPEFCGYAATPTREVNAKSAPDSKIANYGFRPTRQYAYPRTGIHLGSVMAISGAAASPNEGYNTSPANAFLMTVFNVRLGWWLSNTRHTRTWHRSSPRWGLLYLIREVLAATNNKSAYLYLSDGGHFENLGLYELVRRRCRYIIVCDGSQDGELSFEDLANAIRKCRTDFGAEIQIGVDTLRVNENGRSSAHCVVGKVLYKDGKQGKLLYVKPTLTGDEPADILEYKSVHLKFPHESTVDQFFTESQFESYRKLGYHVMAKAFGEIDPGEVGQRRPGRPIPAKASNPQATYNQKQDLENVFEDLERRWYPASQANEKSFGKYAEKFDELNDRLRSDPKLHSLGYQFYPELADWSEPKVRAADPENFWPQFHYCTSLFQLMEDVYMDLKLEDNFSHPDNEGWINTFYRWANSETMRLTWAVTANMFGSRFRSFLQRRFHFELGEVKIEDTVLSEGDLNKMDPAALQEYRRKKKEGVDLYRLLMESSRGKLPIGFVLVRGRKLDYIWIAPGFRALGLGIRAMSALLVDDRFDTPTDQDIDSHRDVYRQLIARARLTRA